jgi:hypothetical protein
MDAGCRVVSGPDLSTSPTGAGPRVCDRGGENLADSRTFLTIAH